MQSNSLFERLFGWTLATVLVISGIFVLRSGIVGSIDWSIEIFDIKMQMAGAPSGIVLCVLGILLVVWITRN